jgi:hypothetical protein
LAAAGGGRGGRWSLRGFQLASGEGQGSGLVFRSQKEGHGDVVGAGTSIRCNFLALYAEKDIIFATTWRVEFLDEGVQAELEALPVDIRARFLRITWLIEAEGAFTNCASRT